MPTPIEDIKSRVDVVDFIGEYLRLTPGGANWRARCPFHAEKSPSFMVSRAKGIWHCFGCNKGGDIFAFLQEMEGIEFVEALRLLAKRAGVTLEARDPQLASQRNKMLDIIREAVSFAHDFLLKSEQAVTARQYLAKRQVSEDTIDLFQIGYMPDAWDTLKLHLQDKGFSEADIFSSGLIVKRQQGPGSYDRFRNRILFPINDVHGNPIGFGGRVLEGAQKADSPEAGAKYINTPQSLIYDKSSVLYGIDRAKQDIKREGVAVVVEGYMDCISSHQAGVRNVVASSGTALTEQQVRLLKRFTTTVILSFDADAAGQEAAKRGVGQALQQELSVKILEIPQGKDPDELIQKDIQLWRDAIATAKSALDYFFAAAQKRHDRTQLEGKKGLTRELLPLIAQAQDPVEQTHYLKQLGELVGVEARILQERLPRSGAASRQPTAPERSTLAAPVLAPTDRFTKISQRLVAGLLKFPDQLPFVAEQLAPSAVTGPEITQLYTDILLWYSEHQHFTAEEFRASVSDPAQQSALDVLLLLADREFPDDDSGLTLRRDFDAMIHSLKQQAVRRQLTEVAQTITRLEQSGQRGPELDQKLEQVIRQFHTLSDELQQLGE